MKLENVKQLVNLKTLAETIDEFGVGDFFDEDLEFILSQVNDEVYKALGNSEFDKDALEYLDNLKILIRNEILNMIRTISYKSLEGIKDEVREC